MASSGSVSLTEVARALETLTLDETKELFLYLNVPLHLIKNVSTHQSVNICKIEYIRLWIDHDLEASWERIVAGLEQIGKKALAYRLALQYYGKSLSAPDKPSSLSPSPLPSATPAAIPNMELSLCPSTPPPPPTSSPPPDRVAQVMADIDKLRDSYSDLTSDARDELCVRENSDPSFLKRFRDRLFDLPIAKKDPHDQFFHKNKDGLLRAKDVENIFAILRLYCSYSNYDVLREVVQKFCEAILQRRMREYTTSLEIFEKATTIDVYLAAESAGPVLTEEFIKMTITIKKPPNECTLYEVRKLKEKITERASLHPYCAYIRNTSQSSVKVELGIHVRCVGKILAVLTPQFLSTHLLSDVMLGDEELVTMDNVPQKKLNEELISASKRGDIMRVTSVLNSGADIQTVDDEHSRTALDWASQKGHLQIVHLLIVRGSGVDSRDKGEPSARHGHAAVGIGQSLLVWGGGGVKDSSIIERFDMVSATWRDGRRLQGDLLPTGLHYMAITSDGENGYMFGGLGSGRHSDRLFRINLLSLDNRELLPSTESSRPSARSSNAIIYDEGKLVSYGGDTDSGAVLDDLHVFDLEKKIWSVPATTGDQPPALMGHSLTTVASKTAILFAGHDGYRYRNNTYLLDLKIWRWREVKTSGRKPAPRSRHTACCISDTITGHHPLLIVVGGFGDRGLLSDVWLLDLTNELWNEVDLPTPLMPRYFHTCVLFGVGSDFRVLVIFGGETGGRSVSETTLLLLSQRGGSWIVERVVYPADWKTPDDTLRNQLRRLIVSSRPLFTAESPKLDDQFSLEVLANIAKDHMRIWESLSPYLGLSHQKDVEISRKYQGDYGRQRRECLEAWREAKGSGATYRALIIAAEEAKDNEMAESVRRLLVSPPILKIPESGKIASLHSVSTELSFTSPIATPENLDEAISVKETQVHKKSRIQNAISVFNSCFTSDEKYPGIRFYGNPRKQQVSSSHAQITTWREELGVELNIPAGAVPPDKEVEVSVWPCINGPFILPEEFELASSIFHISSSLQFSKEITLTMEHFSQLDSVNDCEEMVFLSAPSSIQIDGRPMYNFKVVEQGVFLPNQDFGQVNLTHFCKVGIGRRKKKSRKLSNQSYHEVKRSNKRYVYKVYKDKRFEDEVIFSAFLDQKLFYTKLNKFVKEYSPEFFSTSPVPIIVVEEKIALRWPETESTGGWDVIPDRLPCALTRELLDGHERDPYPPIIILKMSRPTHCTAQHCKIPVHILGIKDTEKCFNLLPKVRLSESSSPTVTEPPFQSYIQTNTNLRATRALPEPTKKDLSHFVKVTKAYDLGLNLNLDEKELEDIRSNHQYDHDRQRSEVFTLYLKRCGKPSWMQVVNALQLMEERRLAQELMERFGIVLQTETSPSQPSSSIQHPPAPEGAYPHPKYLNLPPPEPSPIPDDTQLTNPSDTHPPLSDPPQSSVIHRRAATAMTKEIVKDIVQDSLRPHPIYTQHDLCCYFSLCFCFTLLTLLALLAFLT